MENASKALLIGGGMLLVILILTFAVYLFQKIGTPTQELYRELTESEITEFNQLFQKYDTTENNLNGLEKLRIQDVVSVINLAKRYNDKPKFPITIKVTFNNNDVFTNNGHTIKNEYQLEKLLSNSNKEDKEDNIRYTCKVIIPNGSKFVEEIDIEKIT